MNRQLITPLGSLALIAMLAIGCQKTPSAAPPATTNTVQTVAPAAPTIAPTGPPRRHVSVASGNKVRIDGTSNIHDWNVNGQVISGVLEVNPQDLFKGQAGRLPASVEVKIPVRSLKSGNGKMDEVMQEHMRMDQFPMIHYKLAELVITKPATNGPVACLSKGDLVIAGVTNQIAMPVTIAREETDRLKVSGTIDLKMTSFKIDPPQPKPLPFVTGDDVKITLEWLMKEKQP